MILIGVTTIWEVKCFIFLPSDMLSPVVTPRYTNLMLKRSIFLKKVCKDHFSFTLFKMFPFIIVQKTKLYVKTTVGKLNEEFLPTRILWKSQILVWLNVLKAIFSSLIMEFYGWKVKGDHNVISKKFNGNQLPPSTGNSNETNNW